jgi:SOS-response transcriptional repressor LexA
MRQRIMGYREVQVFEYVRTRVAVDGIAPSYAMIRDELGIATKGEVCRIVHRLERRQMLRRDGIGTIARRGVRRIRLVNMLTV